MRRTSTIGTAAAPALLVPERREAALELGHGAVHGGEVLRGAGGQRAVEVGERARRRQPLGALDQVALELAAQVALELVQALAVERRHLLLGLGPRLGLEPERAPDALHVDADHARALAAAPEGLDREPGEVAHLAVAAVGDRLADRFAQLVEVELAGPLVALLRDSLSQRLGLRGAEEVAVEEQLEDAAVLLRLRERRRHRLAKVGGLGPRHRLERLEGVQQLGGADAEALAAKLLGEGDDPRRKSRRELAVRRLRRHRACPPRRA